MISRLRELPDDVAIVHHPNWPRPAPRGEHGIVQMRRPTYEMVDEYARSTPTAASAGRCWRRLHHVDGLDNQPVLFIVENDPDDPTGQYHHPHLVLFLEDE